MRYLHRLQKAPIEKDGKRVTIRAHVGGQIGRVVQPTAVAFLQTGVNTAPDPPNSQKV